MLKSRFSKIRMHEKPFLEKYGCLKSRSSKSTDAWEAVSQKVRMPEKPFLKKYGCLKNRSSKSTDAWGNHSRNTDAWEAVPRKVRMHEKPFLKKYGCMRSRSSKRLTTGINSKNVPILQTAAGEGVISLNCTTAGRATILWRGQPKLWWITRRFVSARCKAINGLRQNGLP